MIKIALFSIIALIISGCTATSYSAMKNDPTVNKKSYTVDQNYQKLYRTAIDFSHECHDIGLITGALSSDGQLYTDIKEGYVYTYVIGGFGRQMRFGTEIKAINENESNMTIFYYGGFAENAMESLYKQYTGKCPGCKCE